MENIYMIMFNSIFGATIIINVYKFGIKKEKKILSLWDNSPSVICALHGASWIPQKDKVYTRSLENW